ncbi:capsular polysaccharide export protein, LipB/KpsS family, partial [Gilvimarinus sp. 1_MG-2023]|uniref:capsular polysaccharide export protein, LipB/KpsS family n=1 Tax=Gilvimarinus sp. 1_MG-2023 TaxID=3062638 RepID=UPI0026E33A1B
SKAASDNGKVLLLQGPVGPFFKRLQRYLTSEGMDVNRICFNPADLLYSCRKNRIYFSGGFIEWRRWLRKYLHVSRPDVIILFGSERPAYRIARQLAERLGIRVLSLEEGYIRPGFVAMEEGGN